MTDAKLDAKRSDGPYLTPSSCLPMSIFFHEQLHRSAEIVERLHTFPVTLCGAGALGANVAESLARSGIKHLTIIDDDRVEERNLSTQPYQHGDIGAFKARMMANMLYRAVGARVDAQIKRLDENNVGKLLGQSPLVVDTFDNSKSRGVVTAWCAETETPCLHVGLAQGYAEVIWNDRYRVPSPTNDDVCDYPLARNLVTLAVSVACEVIVTFVATGERQSYTVTLNDFSVRPFV